MPVNNIEIVQSPILQTTNYEQFQILHGNRVVDANHVKQLKKLMIENGNLTQDFPVLVSPDNRVIDGQHRLTALEELGWPVFYQVRENMNLEQVRAINVGHKNWSWYDFAISYANLGNENYKRFVALADEYPRLGYGVLARYCGMKDIRSGAANGTGLRFRKGELTLTKEQCDRARAGIEQWLEVAEHLSTPDSILASAFYIISQSSNYDHQHMLSKVSQFANRFFPLGTRLGSMSEGQRLFEELYNFNRKDGEVTRLY